MKKADYVAKILFLIPTIYFIGVSGSVAMQNAKKEDDIDLFLIVKKQTVWVSRLLLLLFLQVLGIRRKRGAQFVSDKICVNMIIDEEALPFPKDRQDIYTAHEIVQIVPLRDRHDTYQRFLQQNSWIQQHMIHAYTKKKTYRKHGDHLLASLGSISLSMAWIEHMAWGLQQWIMKRHKTSETVTKHMLAFHPFDYRVDTLRRFEEKVKKYVYI